MWDSAKFLHIFRINPTIPGCLAGWAVVVLTAYAVTLHRGLGGGDSGELSLVAASAGIAHPPGYPLYTVLGGCFSLLPWGSVAQRLNFFSACCATSASCLLFAAVQRWSGRLAPAVVAAGLLSFGAGVWQYATVAEVFALHLLFITWMIYASTRLASDPAAACRCALTTAAGLGLGLGHHQTLLFFLVPWLAWALPLYRRAGLQGRRLGTCLLALCCGGALPNLYLYLAAWRIPLVGWGQTDSLWGLLRHVLRADYGSFVLSRGDTAGEASWALRFGDVLRAMPDALSWGGVLLLLVGAVWAVAGGGGRQRLPHRRLAQGWLGAAVFYLVVFCALNNMRRDNPLALAMQGRFFLQAWAVGALGAGLGFWRLQRRLVWLRGGRGLLAAALLVGLQAWHNAPTAAQVRGGLLESWGRRSLQAMPPHSLLLTQGDHVWATLRYLQLTDALRPDVAVIDVAQLSYPWSRRWAWRHFPELVDGLPTPQSPLRLGAVIASQLPRRPVLTWNVDSHSLPAGSTTLPYGPARLVWPAGRGAADLNALRTANEFILADDLPAWANRFPAASWEAYAAQEYTRAQQFFGSRLLSLAQHSPMGLQPATLHAGIGALEQVARRAAAPGAEVWQNLHAAYHLMRTYEPELLPPHLLQWQRFLSRCAPGCAPQKAQAIRQLLALSQP